MTVGPERWEILGEWKEERRTYLSVKCKLCFDEFPRLRKEQIFGKKLKQCSCNMTIRGKPFQAGERFGKLVVVGRSGSTDKNSIWEVICDCGNTRYMQGSQIRSGETASCGCYLTEKRGSTRENHGKTGTKEYKVWCSVVNRTTRPTESTREWYFDKGIKVSPEWRASFTAFLEDMARAPKIIH